MFILFCIVSSMNSLDLSSYFQAGTPNIAGGVALTTAIDYLMNLGMENIHKHEKEIVNYAINSLSNIFNAIKHTLKHKQYSLG